VARAADSADAHLRHSCVVQVERMTRSRLALRVGRVHPQPRPIGCGCEDACASRSGRCVGAEARCFAC
jgi:hypothetical protein